MDETQNDAPFVAFYDMHAVTFVPPDEMADVTTEGMKYPCPTVIGSEQMQLSAF